MPDRPEAWNAVVDRVITQNVWVHAPLDLARAVLTSLLTLQPSVLGLQEWPNDRNRILKDIGVFQRWPGLRRHARRLTRRRWKPTTGWITVRPILGPTGPTVLQRDRYEVTRVKAKKLTGRRRVNPTKKHPKKVLSANRASLVETIDHALDQRTVFIGYHLWAGVQRGGGYSNLPADRARVDGHRDQVAMLQALIDAYLGRGWAVYLLGDSNFDGLRFSGVTSAWASRPHDPRGTHGGPDAGPRKIDDVHGPGLAYRVDVIWDDDQRIDHAAVVADRHRKVAR